MNTAALKTFAPAVRKQLMEAVTRKLEFALTAQTPDYLTTFAPQVAALRKLEQKDRAGLIERVAYTWFNRLAALRFMDAHDWHPFRARVLTPASAAETQPELLKLTRTGALSAELVPHTNPKRLNDLLDGRIPSPDAQGEVYRHLVLAACHFYHALLPNIFEKLDDETELLLPDDLLTEQSVINGFRTEISDEDCAEVEILGWLYQFYISERKDQVMARKSAVPTEDIPAVTQLFTPHWIVRYLVENSLGRLWLLNRPNSKLRERMPYYIEGEGETDFLKISKPEEIKLLDPASGSGHMLTYAFDLLSLIYEEEGYAPSEIPALILRHNLYGLDICPRAAQLAELALVFKAREKSRRFFQPEQIVRPAIFELREVRFGEGELSAYFKAIGAQPSKFHPELTKLLYQFEEAKIFGSLIQPCLNEQEIQQVRSEITARQSAFDKDLMVASTHQKVLRVIEQAEALTQRYQVVVANPPYMGGKLMNIASKEMGKKVFPNSKADTFAMFMERGYGLTHVSGYAAFVTMQSWMFLPTFAELRRTLLTTKNICTLAHLGPRAFPTISGEVVQTAAFVISNRSRHSIRPIFFRLTTGNSDEKSEMLRAGIGRFDSVTPTDLMSIPLFPIVYWLSDAARSAFKDGRPLTDFGMPRQGNTTTNNDRFVRQWSEVAWSKLGFGCNSLNQFREHRKKWAPYNKGGGTRKWYGLNESVVNWENDGAEIKAIPHSVVANEKLYMREGVTWSTVSSSNFGFRSFGKGYIFDNKGACLFSAPEISDFLLALLNSRVCKCLLIDLVPTVSIQPGDVGRLPVIQIGGREAREKLIQNTGRCVGLAHDDWDNFEISWDFSDQPLLRSGLKGATLEASWRNWEAHSTAAIRRMQELETENNRLFIAAYGLDGELSPEVPEEQITLARADARRDMAAFLSYAVGCMMGR